MTLPSETPLISACRSYDCGMSSIGASGAPDWSDDAAQFLLPERLHQVAGIVGEYIYTGEVFSNTRGGLNTNDATRYRGNLDLVLIGDTEAMNLWAGGRFFVYGNHFHGRTLSPEDVGDAQYYSNIEGFPRPENKMQLTEYWYEHVFAEGAIVVKAGKQDANADFAYVDLGGDFVNSSFGLIPTVPLPTWPNPGMGLAVLTNIDDTYHFKFGVYDGTPTTGPDTGGRSGFETLGDYGAMTLVELMINTSLSDYSELVGGYRIGGWYHSDDFDDLRSGAPATKSGNFGFYAGADQLLWRESDEEDVVQGLGVFFQFGWAPSDRNEIDQYLGTGVTYRGLLPGRDEDLIGLAIANASFRDNALDSERAVECFYRLQMTTCWSLQPDVQYIANPAGDLRDALVAGVRTEIVL